MDLLQIDFEAICLRPSVLNVKPKTNGCSSRFFNKVDTLVMVSLYIKRENLQSPQNDLKALFLR